MDITVFYAWQSDTPETHNKKFIRKRIEKALERLKRSGTIEESPRIDSDTRGLAGSPEIAATIFRKIQEAAIFIGDVSFVGRTAESGTEPKHLPNPNVLVEMGFAASSVGWDRVILVMNTAFGDPKHQIFDIRHRRWPLQYSWPPAELDPAEAVVVDLEEALARAIRMCLSCDHEAVAEAAASLDTICIKLLGGYGRAEFFSDPPHFPIASPSLSEQDYRAGVRALLQLRVIRCEVVRVGDQMHYAYHWTYLGRMLLERLDLRRAPSREAMA